MQDSTNAATHLRDSNDRHRAPEAIRRDIRETRGDMDRTVDELLDRFSVGGLVDEAWRRMRQGGGAGGMDVGGMLRDHPVPIALVGLGLGWLAVEQANVRSDSAGSESAGKVASDVAHRAADVGHDVADTAVSMTREEVEDIRNPDAGKEPFRSS